MRHLHYVPVEAVSAPDRNSVASHLRGAGIHVLGGARNGPRRPENVVDVSGELSVHVAVTDVPFHLTRLGRTYYEHQVPELLRQLARLNKNLEEVAEALREAGSGEGERSEADRD